MGSSTQFERHWENIATHYRHAIQKHPRFCNGHLMQYRDPHYLKGLLDIQRKRNEEGFDSADSILAEELLEQELAISQGDWRQAIYETYDCIAVLMRMAEMMERKATGGADG